jgi:hypothetical protein
LVAPEHTSGNLDTEACAVDKIVDTAITNDPPDSTPFNSRHANGSTASTWNQQNSTNFSQLKNAVRRRFKSSLPGQYFQTDTSRFSPAEKRL